MELKHYQELSKVSTKELTESKNGLTYLTWSLAFDKLLEKYPDTTYEIVKYDGKPYFIDDSGAIVYTKMTIEGITREMWLPVLDGANKPMKKQSYEYTTKYGVKTCEAINMFDINKAIMRCLVKNIAMFGLGLNIYAGEDLPLGEDDNTKITQKPHKEQINKSEEAFKKSLEDGSVRNIEIDLGKCPKCGALNKWSEKANKAYCSALCWKSDIPVVLPNEVTIE